MRWRLFGHILRLDEEAPANQAMSVYFQTDGLHGYRNRPKKGLLTPLDTELQQIDMRLKTRADLEQLRQIAINKTKWGKLHRTIQEKRCKRSKSQLLAKLAVATAKDTFNALIIYIYIYIYIYTIPTILEQSCDYFGTF